jgi:hypothetical protein
MRAVDEDFREGRFGGQGEAVQEAATPACLSFAMTCAVQDGR